MQQIVRTIAQAYNTLPRPHRVMLGSLTIVTLAVAVWRPMVYPPVNDAPVIIKDADNERNQPKTLTPPASEPLDAPSSANANSADSDDNTMLDQPTPSDDIPKDELDDNVSDGNAAHEYVVSTGDTLSSILTQYGIDMSDIAALAEQNSGLRNLKIGQQISWELGQDGDLQSLRWQVSRREVRTYTRKGDVFKEAIENMQGDWHNKVLTGRLTGSFVNSALNAGLTNGEVREVIKALQWQLDFRKLRLDDRFSVLMSREVLDGHNEQSELLGVRLRSGGKDYYAFRSEDGKFYDREGSGLSRGFMRFPTMKQFKISSNFNPRRLNPVTGRVAPHRGVDFALPVGTPVLAIGDGEVVVAKRDGAAGNYIALRHGRQYTTRYMHLSRLLVKPGQKVKRGDRIALSGNTGRSTGPHLHYEVWINQQAVNPLTAKLPRSEGLDGKERRDYLAQVREMLPQLQLD
ncbi:MULTISPECIES: murein DD-endopeptidase MepM [Lonsdalea]|uniref:murein DD-endopeptidase MepM n=1 Tax=Lonsdalea TaxID=1082702 RepID=UPI000A230A03|nr:MULTISPECIES: murein DD-endopeptidase MepM [Lonsdalea]OSM96084.1 peptidase [Lonsdalea populi]RAT68286.1 peptidase [Lonsdalea populi]RAT71887.1 peptidase [Lonsdalea populi]RAT76336.1 peptidase [Lonsdalea populi]RAT80018.1 peptidase [Lonsdalea populi]